MPTPLDLKAKASGQEEWGWYGMVWFISRNKDKGAGLYGIDNAKGEIRWQPATFAERGALCRATGSGQRQDHHHEHLLPMPPNLNPAAPWRTQSSDKAARQSES